MHAVKTTYVEDSIPHPHIRKSRRLPGGHAGDSLLRTTYGEDAPTNPAAPTVGRYCLEKACLWVPILCTQQAGQMCGRADAQLCMLYGRRNPFMTSKARPRGAYGDGYAAENQGVLGSALSGTCRHLGLMLQHMLCSITTIKCCSSTIGML